MALFQQKNLAVSVFKRRLLFSLKVRPLKEGKYYPAIAVGCNDQIGQLKVKGIWALFYELLCGYD